jgi:hypothetical protein
MRMATKGTFDHGQYDRGHGNEMLFGSPPQKIADEYNQEFIKTDGHLKLSKL